MTGLFNFTMGTMAKLHSLLKSEAEEIVPTIRECLDMNTIFF